MLFDRDILSYCNPSKTQATPQFEEFAVCTYSGGQLQNDMQTCNVLFTEKVLSVTELVQLM